MSAGLTKPRRGPLSTLAVPVISDPVNAQQVNLALAVIQQYEAQRAARETQSIPNFAALRMISPNGTTWQLTVQDNGSFLAIAVPRT